ncbi:MAG: sulfite exporter TauE/SafE family protein [Betaproteobacteria bacterium]|nr:MAG: sulfite exporter TauE/SafE family protein [Betaproteobacteria bacterium]
MSVELLASLCVAFFLVATLYTTVGHAGASGYLAVMGLAGLAAATMRPTALTLNILVALVTVIRFRQARLFSWRGLWPFLLGSVPFAALGGSLRLKDHSYYALVGAVLLMSALILVWRAFGKNLPNDETLMRVKTIPAIFIGAIIGMLSGLTGTGGGIFLSPTLLFLAWAGPKTTAGIAAPFILVNSTVALAANFASTRELPSELPYLAVAALCGALIGSWLGASKLPSKALLILLACAMSLAGMKLLLTA